MKKKNRSDVHGGTLKKLISVIVDKLPRREFISITILINSKKSVPHQITNITGFIELKTKDLNLKSFPREWYHSHIFSGLRSKGPSRVIPVPLHSTIPRDRARQRQRVLTQSSSGNRRHPSPGRGHRLHQKAHCTVEHVDRCQRFSHGCLTPNRGVM